MPDVCITTARIAYAACYQDINSAFESAGLEGLRKSDMEVFITSIDKMVADRKVEQVSFGLQNGQWSRPLQYRSRAYLDLACCIPSLI